MASSFVSEPRAWNTAALAPAAIKQAHLDHKGPVGHQFARLRGKHQQPRSRRQRKAAQRQRQRQPREIGHRQGPPPAPDPQLQQHQVAQQQGDADDVHHLQRRVGPGVGAQRRERRGQGV
jgi:hypothetical protein